MQREWPALRGRLTTILLAVGLFPSAATCFANTVPLHYLQQTEPLPLKGIDANADPQGTFVWKWIPMDTVMRGPELFDWSTVESQLERASEKGRHTILRPFLDDVSRANPFPKYWLKLEGATSTNVLGHVVPVYSHPAVREALVHFVESFGAHYDGDPRIGFIEAGLLGEWGEGWAPRGHSNPSLEVTPETQESVYAAYQRAFKRTHILLPKPSTNSAISGFGFHNDAFAFWKLPDSFHDRLQRLGEDALGRWRRAPVFGRAHPEFSDPRHFQPLALAEILEERLKPWIEREHLSCFRLVNPKAMPKEIRERFLEVGRFTGYDLHVRQFEWLRNGATMRLKVAVTNAGVAPFYYPWPVELAFTGKSGRTPPRVTNWDIRRVVPGGGEILFETEVTANDLPKEDSIVMLRIPNSLPHAPPIRFSNREQDQDTPGWLSLGEIRSGE